MARPTEIARRLYEVLESPARYAELRTLLADDVVAVEFPSLVKPHGARSTFEQMLAAARTGAAMLSEQSYRVDDAIDHEDTAVVRLTWTGTVASDTGPLHAGQQLRAHVAQFVTVLDDRITALASYDCYDPLV